MALFFVLLALFQSEYGALQPTKPGTPAPDEEVNRKIMTLACVLSNRAGTRSVLCLEPS